MNRWLLNNLATWELGLLIVGGFVLVALIGMKVTWRWLPALRDGESNDVAGVILVHGRESAQGWRDLAAIYATLRSYQPKTVVQTTFYAEAVARVNDLAGARRQRLNDAEEALPPTFNVLLVGGALLLLAVTFLFGTRNPRLHLVLAVSVAVLLGFNLLLALVLDYPFSGSVAVANHPFTQGALADFEHVLEAGRH